MTALSPLHLRHVSSVVFHGVNSVKLEGDHTRTFHVNSPKIALDYMLTKGITVSGKFRPALNTVDYVDTLNAPSLAALGATPCARCEKLTLAEYCLDCDLLRSDEAMASS